MGTNASASHALNDLLSGAIRPAAASSTLATTAKAATVVWLVGTAVNFVVWLLVCVISASFDAPWWLWFGCAGAVITGGLRLAAHRYQPRPQPVAQAVQTVPAAPAARVAADAKRDNNSSVEDGEDW